MFFLFLETKSFVISKYYKLKNTFLTIRDSAGYEQAKQRAYEFIEKYKDKFLFLIKIFKEDLVLCQS